MSYQNISVELPQADIDAVRAAFATINAKLPFLVSLTPEEIKKRVKVGAKSVDFVQDGNSAVTGFPQILPASFEAAEFTKDTNLYKALAEFKVSADSLQAKIKSTYLAVGSEAMVAALEVFKYVETAAPRTPGLQPILEKMRQRFKGQGKKKKKNKNNEEGQV